MYDEDTNPDKKLFDPIRSYTRKINPEKLEQLRGFVAVGKRNIENLEKALDGFEPLRWYSVIETEWFVYQHARIQQDTENNYPEELEGYSFEAISQAFTTLKRAAKRAINRGSLNI